MRQAPIAAALSKEKPSPEAQQVVAEALARCVDGRLLDEAAPALDVGVALTG